MTYERLLHTIPNENIIVVTHKAYRSLVIEHLPQLPLANILCEPSRNNTAPCIAYAMYNIKARSGVKASFAVLPSDHIIMKEEQFSKHLEAAFVACESSASLITMGILPTRPDTGYGYIHLADENNEVKKVLEFKEKPDYDTAVEYLQSGKYVWNAGIFIWSVDTLEKAFSEHYPQITDTLNLKPELYNTEHEKAYLDEVYPKTDALSIDYAIMENADNIYNIVADIGWSDLGTWASLYDYGVKDDANNFTQGGVTVMEGVVNSIIKTQPNKKTIIRGLDNYIVIDDNDALLIYPKENEQEIKNSIKKL
jgi:mannose-1-phosphate guanylyltransferase